MSDLTKTCKECKQEFSYEDFYITNPKYQTRNPRCKKCFSAYTNDNRRYTTTENYEGPEQTLETAIHVLKILGYDTSKDVHPQFMERFNKWKANRSLKKK